LRRAVGKSHRPGLGFEHLVDTWFGGNGPRKGPYNAEAAKWLRPIANWKGPKTTNAHLSVSARRSRKSHLGRLAVPCLRPARH
jgi:hypothetical protein